MIASSERGVSGEGMNSAGRTTSNGTLLSSDPSVNIYSGPIQRFAPVEGFSSNENDNVSIDPMESFEEFGQQEAKLAIFARAIFIVAMILSATLVAVTTNRYVSSQEAQDFQTKVSYSSLVLVLVKKEKEERKKPNPTSRDSYTISLLVLFKTQKQQYINTVL
jgi:hypothetical protein